MAFKTNMTKVQQKGKFGGVLNIAGIIGFVIIFIIVFGATFGLLNSVTLGLRVDQWTGFGLMILMIASLFLSRTSLIGLPIIFFIGWWVGSFQLGFSFLQMYLIGSLVGWFLVAIPSKLPGLAKVKKK